LPQFLDARAVPDGSVLSPDLAIIGGGPAGISLALALANSNLKVLLLESGAMHFNARTQNLYAGEEVGIPYVPLDETRLRYLGGSTNHWGGWCRPLTEIDFEQRSWVPYSGWPFGRATLEPYFPRAQKLVEAGPFVYDALADSVGGLGPLLELGLGGVYSSFFQFSQWAGNPEHLPTHFGERYAADLKRIPNLDVMLYANVTGLRLSANATSLDHLDIATLSGRRFRVQPRAAVVATGAIESARLLLASNDVMTMGVGNQNDLVGRFFADHAIPRNTATLVVFQGALPSYYTRTAILSGLHFRATLAASDAFKRSAKVLGSLTTIEQGVALDAVGTAAVTQTSSILGVDASGASAYALGCGFELHPDPNRRLTLTHERDALGMPRLKLTMTISDADFASYQQTLQELGRQLLAARSGMLRLDRTTRAEWLSGLSWGNHHMGTTRMHVDPKQGVADANGRVHGIANLYLAGSGLFPTYGASNPTMNLVALTLRLADHLKGALV
jgi:choline dehydrogenase-like flavoprotein